MMPSFSPRVLHLSTALDWRGGEQQVLLLQREWERMGISSAVVCSERSVLSQKLRQQGLAALTYPASRLSVRRLLPLVRLFQPHVLHLHDPDAHTVAVVASYLGRVRLPLILHRKVDFEVGKNGLSRWKYGYSGIRRVIAVSGAVKVVLERSGAVRAPIEVVYDAFDPERLPTGPALSRFRDSSSTPVVGTVAAFADHKDPYTFLEAAARVQAEVPKARFVWLGEGELRTATLLKAKQMGLNFEAPGFVDDVLVRMQSFTVLMYSSKAEGLGSSLIDAMALGLPIASTAAGGIAELFEPGVQALLSRPRDAEALAQNALRLLSDAELRRAIGERAGVRSRDFLPRIMAQKTLEIDWAVLEGGD
ncbi:glycosyltransferase [bacterium]|nr:glycosyltransferase [bacterium]